MFRRPRRRLFRHPVPFWIAAIAVAAITTSSISRAASAADAARDRWGRLVEVTIARDDLAPGDEIGASDVEVLRVPAGLVPSDAVDGDVVGRVATSWVASGEIVLAPRVSSSLLPPGTRGVAVPHGMARLPVQLGDRVDLLATFETETVTVAIDAVVIAAADDAITVAVDERDVEAVASALTIGSVMPVLSERSPRR